MAKSWLPLVAWALLCGRATVLAAQQDGGGRAGLERPIALPTGERRAVELGYGVSHLDIDSLAAAQSPTTLTQLLTGRIAGLVVMQSSGTIGAGSRLLNRGATSLFVSNAPLLYVDGVRADQSPNAYGLDVGGQVPSRFDDLDVADIAAVDVLRGPAATALYGADAANGVILVTTRRGTPGPVRIHSAVTQGFVATSRRFPENLFAVDPSGTWCSLLRKAAGGCGQDRILLSNALESPATSPLGHGAVGGYGLDVSGGTGRLRYYAAGRWQGQGGVYGLPTAEVDRLTARAHGSGPPEDVRTPNYLSRTSARANVDFHVSPRAAVSLATGYLSSAVRMPINDNNILGVLPSGFLGFGDSTINDGWGFFPPGDVFQIRTSQAVERLTGSLRGTWRPLSFLETSFLVGMDRVRQSDRQVQARGEGPNIAGLRLGRVLGGRANSDHYSIELGARAAFHLSPALATRTAVGLQYFNATGDTLLRLGRGLQTGDTSLADAAVQTVLADAQGSNRVTGLFLEQELSLRERLFVTASLRHDAGLLGQAALAGATYPALGVSWLAPTRADAPLGLLRLRAAYGVAGRRPLLSAALAAERTRELEGGADAALWDSRLQLGVTLYDRRTSGVVVPSASAPSGLGIANLGRLSNRGIEIALTAEILRGEARSWDAWLTAWGNRNRITTLGGPPLRFALTTGDQVYQEGLPAGAYSMLPIKRYSDANGDGIITPSEVVVGSSPVFLGTPFPTQGASLGTTLTWRRRVRVSALLEYRAGNSQLNSTEYLRCFYGSCRALNDPGTPLAREAAVAAAIVGTPAGYVEDAAFLKLREVTITLEAPRDWAALVHAARASLTLVGRNLFTWAGYSGLDPEVSAAGQEGFAMADLLTQPPLRSFAATLRVQF